MKKPLNKMNKADLYELAKEGRDLLRAKNIMITMLEAEVSKLQVRISDGIENYRILKAEYAIDKKALKRYAAQKQLINEELEKPKKECWFKRNFSKLFSYKNK